MVASNTGAYTVANGFRRIDYLKITIYGFALTALWSSLHTIILQVRLLDFVAEAQVNTYLGILAGSGLLLAMVVQPIVGMISDRSGFGWGRRRPYILLGTILVLLCLPGIGFYSGYVAIFIIIYALLQVGSNIAQGPYQAFIPDLVPEGKRGVASGVKSLLEIVGGIALLRLVGPLMDHYYVAGGGFWLWLALGTLAIILLGAMIVTVLTVKERSGSGGVQLPLLSTPFRSFKIDIKAHPDFIWFLVSRLLILMAFVTIQRFAFLFLRFFVDIANPAAETANFITVVGIAMIVVVYPAGRLSDKVGRRPIIAASGLLGALGIALIYLFSSRYGLLMFGGGLLGIAGGAFMSSNWALAVDLIRKGEEARYLGLTNLATAGGSALSLFVIGPMIDFFNGYSPGLGYEVMLLACFIYFLAGSVLLLKIKRRH